MSAAGAIAVGAGIVRLGADIIEGKVSDIPSALHDLFASAVTLIPVEQQKEFLTEASRRFVDLEADVAEQIKLEGV